MKLFWLYMAYFPPIRTQCLHRYLNSLDHDEMRDVISIALDLFEQESIQIESPAAVSRAIVVQFPQMRDFQFTIANSLAKLSKGG